MNVGPDPRDGPEAADEPAPPAGKRTRDVILDPLRDPKVVNAMTGLLGAGVVKLAESLPWDGGGSPDHPDDQDHQPAPDHIADGHQGFIERVSVEHIVEQTGSDQHDHVDSSGHDSQGHDSQGPDGHP